MEYKNSPYTEIPEELRIGYSMDGRIPIVKVWRDDSHALAQQMWDDEYVDSFKNRFTIENINNGTQGREPYAGAAKLLLTAFQKYDISGKNIAVLGSTTPWVETILLNLGNTVKTIEYNVPTSTVKDLTTQSYWDFLSGDDKFDYIVSYSSIEHAGLGRYGDPLNPNEDLKAMETIRKHLSDDGLLFWGCPVGSDTTFWNIHRQYGRIRLPLLFSGLEDIEWFGGDKEQLLTGNSGEQPVVVLKHKK